VLATRNDLAAFLNGDPSARLGKGWRAEVLGDDIRALVEGRASLAFSGKDLVLEPRDRG
jgi:ribonuclease D